MTPKSNREGFSRKPDSGTGKRKSEVAHPKYFLAVVILALGLFLCSPALGAIIEIADPVISWDGMPAIKVRDGSTGNILINQVIIGVVSLEETRNMMGVMADNPWPTQVDIPFTFSYDSLSGRVSLKILNGKNERTLSRMYQQGFRYLRLNLAGEPGETVTVNHLTINGQPFGPYTSGTANNSWYFANADQNPFPTLTLIGTINFSALGGSGSSAEFPKLEFNLGGPGTPVPTPVPPTALLLGSGFLGLGLLGWRRRRS